jgi:signal transduction histidine kinase
MHGALTELLEHLDAGWLWIGADGVVRQANRQGSRMTGLLAGQRIVDPELLQAVRATALVRAERRLQTKRPNAGDGPMVLDCRVTPGPDGDDAYVLTQGLNEPDGTSRVDTLMRAVRQDLRDPLRATTAALGLLQQAAASPDGTALELEALLDRVGALLHVAEQLVDLAALWQGGSLPANDRIELWSLLQQVWCEVEPLAMDRRVRVRFTTDVTSRELATLYGNERWIRRVFIECLQGAIRQAAPGGEIEVAHLQSGPKAGIVLHDCALFAAADGLPRADAIGEQLCRHVLALHGGRLREDIEGERRHLVIELPTGAPHHSDESQLAIAQAQHYARDLAELMQRKRRQAVPEAVSLS